MSIKYNPFEGMGFVPTSSNNTASKNGWARYSDTQYTAGSPLALSQSAAYSTLPNNKGGVVETYLPPGVTTFYDGTKITPENVGDYYSFTIRFTAISTANNGYFDFGIDIGGSQGIIFRETNIFVKGMGTVQDFAIVVPGFTLGTFIANGGIVKIAPINGNMTIYDISYQIAQVFRNK